MAAPNWNPDAQASQKENVKRYLLGGNHITPLEALNMFGCFRLAAVIFSLRDEGMDIVTEKIKTNSGKYIAEYYINPEKLLGYMFAKKNTDIK